MKLLSLFLIGFFALSLVDIPYELFQGRAVSSCCCKAGTICRCQHGNVSFCPIKKMKEMQADASSHCALRVKAAAKAVKNAIAAAEAAGAPFFKAFGCGSSEEHKAAPTFSRDFISVPQSQSAAGHESSSFFKPPFQNNLPQVFYPIERPPQILSLSI